MFLPSILQNMAKNAQADSVQSSQQSFCGDALHIFNVADSKHIKLLGYDLSCQKC